MVAFQAPRYSAWGLPSPAEPNLFTTLSISHHAQRRRDISTLYQTSALQAIEHHVDATTTTLLQRLSSLLKPSKSTISNQKDKSPKHLDISAYIQHYTFDAITALTFSKPIGFLTQGHDISSVQSTIHTYSRYGAVVGVFPEWHSFIFSLLQLLSPAGEVGIASVMAFAARCVSDWNNTHSETEKKKVEEQSEGGEILTSDYMSAFLAKSRRDPKFTVEDGYYHIIANVVAGGETTGIGLVACLSHLLHSPDSLAKLRKELQNKGITKNEPVSLKQTQELPYLQAVIKESLRLFPPAGLVLSRIVPKGGLEICGYRFAEGDSVGINPCVAGVNTEVYGDDAAIFRPERWLEGHDEAATDGGIAGNAALLNGTTRKVNGHTKGHTNGHASGRTTTPSPSSSPSPSLKTMESYFLPFGKGPRTCVGKGVAMMELGKVIPALVLNWDFEIVDEGKVFNDWFVLQQGFLVSGKERK